MKNTVLICAAGLASIFILAACGGGGGNATPNVQTQRPQSRVITCANCQAAQLQALGSAARNAKEGDTVVVTLMLTDSQHAEVLAWLGSGGNLPPPNAICTEGIYETHDLYNILSEQFTNPSRSRLTVYSSHELFAHTHRWAIVRNGITLYVDGRQVHGRYATNTTDLDSADAALISAAIIRRDRLNTPNSNGVTCIICANRNYLVATEEHSRAYAEYYARHNDLANSYRAGDIIRVLEQGEKGLLFSSTTIGRTTYLNVARGGRPATAKGLSEGDYRVVQDGGNLRLAQPITLPTGGRANNCNAAPTVQQYYVVESGDNAWRTNRGFAFNMRGILTGAAAIQTDNFLFAHANNLRDLHMELRTDQITLGGLGIYADTGYKSENNGETQAHYGKLMGVYPLLPDGEKSPALDLYASTSAGKVHSDYYEDSRLQGFAAGFFARRFLQHNDEWHVRVRQPLAAREIATWQIAADARIGAPDNMLSIGYYRELHGKSGATLIWRREF